MPRRPTGQLVTNVSASTGKVTSYGVRFRYGGKRRYVTLEATTEQEAHAEMAHLIADVQRGLWTAPEDRAPEPVVREVPTFAQFASDWFRGQCEEGGRTGTGLSERGQEDILWRLGHLRRFGPMKLDEITVESVDKFRRAKVREGTLSPDSVNKLITTLAAILEVAVEYEWIARNPAKGKRRKLRTQKPTRHHLDRAVAIAALLDGASDLDGGKLRRTVAWRRPMVATLVFAGLRIGEALALRWRDVNLADGTIHVRGTKTEAADRVVDLLPILRDELTEYAAALGERDPDAYVFATMPSGSRYGGGKPHTATNIRNRVLAKAVENANARLLKAGEPPLPSPLRPHDLRRTFASLLVALGRDPADFMAQMGHSTAGMTLETYARKMRSQDGERERLRALVEGREWQELDKTRAEAVEARAPFAA